MVKQGKIWTAELFGKPYETTKGKCTASSMSSHPVQQQARAITYSKKQNHIAVSNNFGDVTILDYDDFSKRITTIYKPKEWCETLVYSPNEEYLAIGSHDDAIYIYKIADGKYNHHWSIINVHTSAILGMDWSRDSKYLRAVDQAYAKQFFNVEDCSAQPDGQTSLVDATMWQTATCKLGWEVMGVYPKGADGTDINSVDCNNDRTLVVAGDDFGTICVFRFPVLQQD